MTGNTTHSINLAEPLAEGGGKYSYCNWNVPIFTTFSPLTVSQITVILTTPDAARLKYVWKLPRATTNVQKNKSYVGLFISYVGLYKSYVGDKKSYVGDKKSYVGLIFLHICCGPRKLP